MLQLLSAAIATNGVPSGATAGFDLKQRTPGRSSANRWQHYPTGVILVKSSAGSGTMTVTLRVWCYSLVTAAWHPMGSSATESLRGVLNAQSAIDEDGADVLVHAEPITGLGAFARIYLEVTAIGGTSTAINAYLVEDGGY